MRSDRSISGPRRDSRGFRYTSRRAVSRTDTLPLGRRVQLFPACIRGVELRLQGRKLVIGLRKLQALGAVQLGIAQLHAELGDAGFQRLDPVGQPFELQRLRAAEPAGRRRWRGRSGRAAEDAFGGAAAGDIWALCQPSQSL